MSQEKQRSNKYLRDRVTWGKKKRLKQRKTIIEGKQGDDFPNVISVAQNSPGLISESFTSISSSL